MSQFDSSDSDAPDSSPISSDEIETPRGGFMARPGLKAPPRHAVVVRVGDAPESEHIPVARSSFPPPPPSAPPPESLSEKITLRAIPTPRTPEVAVAELSSSHQTPMAVVTPSVAAGPAVEPPVTPVLFESAPPPSDAPVVSGVVDRTSYVPRSRRAARSRLTILVAAVAGLLLGIVSVITTVHVRQADVTESAAAAPAGVALPPAPEARQRVEPAPGTMTAAPSFSAERQVEDREPAPPAPPARSSSTKRSIF